MIANAVVAEVRHLLSQGDLSQRKIAQRLGVSRGTVNAIAQGRRPDYDRPHRLEDDFVPPAGLFQRCPVCGAKVQMPCLACYVRAILERRRTGGRA